MKAPASEVTCSIAQTYPCCWAVHRSMFLQDCGAEVGGEDWGELWGVVKQLQGGRAEQGNGMVTRQGAGGNTALWLSLMATE